jgi:c(7)-type cytochrome triheme protein
VKTKPKITFWRAVFAAICVLGVYSTIHRFGWGLGAATNLDDKFPWGMWISFDLLVGVALAGGGFTTAAVVHLFNMEKYEPIAKPAVLTAFLGYAMVIVALLYDLGQPWDIWHPVFRPDIMGNTHSVMFEVAFCVALYSSVLFLEFLPSVLEKFHLHTPLRWLKAIYIPLVITGCLLSMMHQSSLGTMFIIAPEKLHGLWYTPLLPFFFFITAVSGGLSMVIVESSLSYRAFGKELEEPLLRGIARVVLVVLGIYLVWRIEDLFARKNMALAFEFTPEAVMFWGEIGLGVVLPMILFGTKRVRHSRQGLFFAGLLTVLGLVVGRLNVGVTGMMRNTRSYWPNWQEFAISIFLVAVGIVAFGLIVKYFPIFEHTPRKAPVVEAERTWRRLPMANGWALASLWLLFGIGLGLVIIANAKDAAAAQSKAPVAAAAPATFELTLPADYTFKNSDSPGDVVFSHGSHIDSKAPNCAGCHSAQFSLQKAGTPLKGKMVHTEMDKGALCGSCHDGKKAFATTDNCDTCHKSN